MANRELSMESIDSGSNYSFGDKMTKAKNPKSAFDLSHLSTMDIYNAGIMFPICSPIECIMGDDMDISVASLIRVLPQEVPLYSRQRLYIYAFYSRCSDLWENWNVFAKKGMLGKTVKEIPTLNSTNFMNGQYNDATAEIKTNSLADYMGLPIGLDPTGETWTGKISALPFMMYTRIWRDYFCNKNALAGNPAVFPDNDDKFRLDDSGRLISAKEMDYTSEGVEHHFNLIWGASGIAEHAETESEQWLLNNEVKHGVTCSVDDTKADIKMGLFYHNWPDDRFTDALPWPQRGDTPELDIGAKVKIDSAIENYMIGIQNEDGSQMYQYDLEGRYNDGGWQDWQKFGYGIGKNEVFTSANFDPGKEIELRTKESSGKDLRVRNLQLASFLNERLKATLNLNQIRELAIAQTELEKMARTDGTYLGFAMTFFGEKPKNALDYKPVYIGGTYTDITFTEVLQTGAATESSPLGNYAGHGIASNSMNEGYIGHIHCDDFGYIMLLGCIMPDVYYSQKVDKMWTRKFQSDLYLPERAKMGMIPVLNYEIDALHAPTGKTVFDLWAWNNPYDELRYRANEIHGQLAEKNEYWFNYTQSRYFDAAPNWGKEFSEAKDVRMNYLSTGNAESAYTGQFKINIRAVRELPYKPTPASII